MTAYATTSVPVERSQTEIRTLLQRFGVERLAFGEERCPPLLIPVAVTFQTRALGTRQIRRSSCGRGRGAGELRGSVPAASDRPAHEPHDLPASC